MRKLLWFHLLWLGACGESSTAPPAAHDAGTITDAPRDIAVTTDAPRCDLGEAPVPESMLPMIRTPVVILGGDAGATAPTPSGGDPTGRWVMTAATMYLPPVARAQVDASRSYIAGTGWGVIDAETYRLSSRLEIHLDTSVVGAVVTPVRTGSRGSYTLDASGAFTFMPECMIDGSGASGMSQFGFSRDAPDRARLFVEVRNMALSARVVIDLQRVP